MIEKHFDVLYIRNSNREKDVERERIRREGPPAYLATQKLILREPIYKQMIQKACLSFSPVIILTSGPTVQNSPEVFSLYAQFYREATCCPINFILSCYSIKTGA